MATIPAQASRPPTSQPGRVRRTRHDSVGRLGGADVRRIAAAGLLATFLVLAMAVPALAHGDVPVVDEVLVLDPGTSASFDAALHYHRLVGQVTGDGPVRVRLVASRTGEERVAAGPGTDLRFNELVRCCDEAWAPHTLLVENVSGEAVTVVARARLVHDDLAVMVDGAESGTRAAIVLLALGWSVLVWRQTRRNDADVPLRRPAIAFALLGLFVLGLGSYASVRYGLGGAPSVVAGNADVPVLPTNPIVSRASLLLGLSMAGWALSGAWWVRARRGAPRMPWTALGIVLVGAVGVVAVAVSVVYGNPLVQVAWFVAAAGPILVVLVSSRSRRQVMSTAVPATSMPPVPAGTVTRNDAGRPRSSPCRISKLAGGSIAPIARR